MVASLQLQQRCGTNTEASLSYLSVKEEEENEKKKKGKKNRKAKIKMILNRFVRVQDVKYRERLRWQQTSSCDCTARTAQKHKWLGIPACLEKSGREERKQKGK